MDSIPDSINLKYPYTLKTNYGVNATLGDTYRAARYAWNSREMVTTCTYKQTELKMSGTAQNNNKVGDAKVECVGRVVVPRLRRVVMLRRITKPRPGDPRVGWIDLLAKKGLVANEGRVVVMKVERRPVVKLVRRGG